MDRRWDANMRVFTDYYCPIEAGYKDRCGVLAYDRAAERAAGAVYRPPTTGAGSEAERTLFVGRLPREAEEADLEKVFSRYGVLAEVRLVRDLVTGAPRGYAFVVFARRRDAASACAGARRLCVLGADVVVEREFSHTMQNWKPRRLGGGLGGRKESGQLRFGGSARQFQLNPHADYSWVSAKSSFNRPESSNARDGTARANRDRSPSTDRSRAARKYSDARSASPSRSSRDRDRSDSSRRSERYVSSRRDRDSERFHWKSDKNRDREQHRQRRSEELQEHDKRTKDGVGNYSSVRSTLSETSSSSRKHRDSFDGKDTRIAGSDGRDCDKRRRHSNAYVAYEGSKERQRGKDADHVSSERREKDGSHHRHRHRHKGEKS